MLSMLLQFSVCICAGKCHRSISLVGNVFLLSMTVYTISCSISTSIDPTESMYLQPLENESHNSLMISNRKFTTTKHFQPLSVELLDSITKQSKQLILRSKEIMLSDIPAELSSSSVLPSTTPGKSELPSPSVLPSTAPRKPELPSPSVLPSTDPGKPELPSSSVLPSMAPGKSEVPSPSVLPSTTLEKIESTSIEMTQLPPSPLTFAHSLVQEHQSISLETLFSKTLEFSTLPTSDLRSVPLKVSSVPIETKTKNSIKLLEAGDQQPNSQLSYTRILPNDFPSLPLSNSFVRNSESEPVSSSVIVTFPRDMSQVTTSFVDYLYSDFKSLSSSFSQTSKTNIQQLQASFSIMNAEFETSSVLRTNTAAVFSPKLELSASKILSTALLATKASTSALIYTKTTNDALLPKTAYTTAVFSTKTLSQGTTTSTTVLLASKISTAAMLAAKTAKTAVLSTKMSTEAILPIETSIAAVLTTDTVTAEVFHTQTATEEVLHTQTSKNEFLATKTSTTAVITTKTSNAAVSHTKTFTTAVFPTKSTIAEVLPTSAAAILPSKTSATPRLPSNTSTAAMLPSKTSATARLSSNTSTAAMLPSKTPAAARLPSTTSTAAVSTTKTSTAAALPTKASIVEVLRTKVYMTAVLPTKATTAAQSPTKSSNAAVLHTKIHTVVVLRTKNASTAAVLPTKTSTAAVSSTKTSTVEVLLTKTGTAVVIPTKTSTSEVSPTMTPNAANVSIKTSTLAVSPTKEITATVLPFKTSTAAVSPTKTSTVAVLPTKISTAVVFPTVTSTAAGLHTKNSKKELLAKKISTTEVSPTNTSTVAALPTETSTKAVSPSKTSRAAVVPKKASTAAMLPTKTSAAVLPRKTSIAATNLLSTKTATASMLPTKTTTAALLPTKTVIAAILPTETSSAESEYIPSLYTSKLITDARWMQREQQYVSQEINLSSSSLWLLNLKTQSSKRSLTNAMILDASQLPPFTTKPLKTNEENLHFMSFLKTSSENMLTVASFKNTEKSKWRPSVEKISTTIPPILFSSMAFLSSTSVVLPSAKTLAAVTLPLPSSKEIFTEGYYAPSLIQRLNIEQSGQSRSYKEMLLDTEKGSTKHRYSGLQTVSLTRASFTDMQQISTIVTNRINESSKILLKKSSKLIASYGELVFSEQQTRYPFSSVYYYEGTPKQSSPYSNIVIPEHQSTKQELITPDTPLSGRVYLSSSFTKSTVPNPEVLPTTSLKAKLTKTMELPPLFIGRIDSIGKSLSPASSVKLSTVTKMLPLLKNTQPPNVSIWSAMATVLDKSQKTSSLIMSVVPQQKGIFSSSIWSLSIEKPQLSSVIEIPAASGTQSFPLKETLRLFSLFTELSVLTQASLFPLKIHKTELLKLPTSLISSISKLDRQSHTITTSVSSSYIEITDSRVEKPFSETTEASPFAVHSMLESVSISSASTIGVSADKLHLPKLTESIDSRQNRISRKPKGVLAFPKLFSSVPPTEVIVSQLESIFTESASTMSKNTPHLLSSFTQPIVSKPRRHSTDFARLLLSAMPESKLSFFDLYSEAQSHYQASLHTMLLGTSELSSQYADLSNTQPLHIPPVLTETLIPGIPQFSSSLTMPSPQVSIILPSKSAKTRSIDTRLPVKPHLLPSFSQLTFSELQSISSTYTGTCTPETPRLSTSFITLMISEQADLTPADTGHTLKDKQEDVKSYFPANTNLIVIPSFTGHLLPQPVSVVSASEDGYFTDILQLQLFTDSEHIDQYNILEIATLSSKMERSESKYHPIEFTKLSVTGISHNMSPFIKLTISDAGSIALTSPFSSFSSQLEDKTRQLTYNKKTPLEAQILPSYSTKTLLTDISLQSQSSTDVLLKDIQQLSPLESNTDKRDSQFEALFVASAGTKLTNTQLLSITKRLLSDQDNMPTATKSTDIPMLSGSFTKFTGQVGEMSFLAATELMTTGIPKVSSTYIGYSLEPERSTSLATSLSVIDKPKLTTSFIDFSDLQQESSSANAASLLKDGPQMSSSCIRRTGQMQEGELSASTGISFTDMPTLLTSFTDFMIIKPAADEMFSKLQEQLSPFRELSVLEEKESTSTTTDVSVLKNMPTHLSVLTGLNTLEQENLPLTAKRTFKNVSTLWPFVVKVPERISSASKFKDARTCTSPSIEHSAIDPESTFLPFAATLKDSPKHSLYPTELTVKYFESRLSAKSASVLSKTTKLSPFADNKAEKIPSKLNEILLTNGPKIFSPFDETSVIEPEIDSTTSTLEMFKDISSLLVLFSELAVSESELLGATSSMKTRLPNFSSSTPDFTVPNSEKVSSADAFLMFKELIQNHRTFTDIEGSQREPLSAAASVTMLSNKQQLSSVTKSLNMDTNSLFPTPPSIKDIPMLTLSLNEFMVKEPDSSSVAATVSMFPEKLASSFTEFAIRESQSVLLSTTATMFTDVYDLSSTFTELTPLEPGISPLQTTESLPRNIPKFSSSVTDFTGLKHKSSSSGSTATMSPSIPKVISSFSELKVPEPESSSAATSVLTYIPKLSSSAIDFWKLEQEKLSSKTTLSVIKDRTHFALSLSEHEVLELENIYIFPTVTLLTDVSKLSSSFTVFTVLEQENLSSASVLWSKDTPKFSSLTEFRILLHEGSLPGATETISTDIPKQSSLFLKPERSARGSASHQFGVTKLASSLQEFTELEGFSTADTTSLLTDTIRILKQLSNLTLVERESSHLGAPVSIPTSVPKLSSSFRKFIVSEPERSFSEASSSMLQDILKLTSSLTQSELSNMEMSSLKSIASMPSEISSLSSSVKMTPNSWIFDLSTETSLFYFSPTRVETTYASSLYQATSMKDMFLVLKTADLSLFENLYSRDSVSLSPSSVSSPFSSTLHTWHKISSEPTQSILDTSVSFLSVTKSSIFDPYLSSSFTTPLSSSEYSIYEVSYQTSLQVLTTEAFSTLPRNQSGKEKLQSESLQSPTGDSSSFSSTAWPILASSFTESAIKRLSLPFTSVKTTVSSSSQQRSFSSALLEETLLLPPATTEMISLLKFAEVTSVAASGMESTLSSELLPETIRITSVFHTADSFLPSSVVTSYVATSISTESTKLPPKKIGSVSSLSVGILVKIVVDIKSNEFKIRIEEGLIRCYNEGIAKNSETGSRRKRVVSNATVEVTDMKRNDVRQEHIDVKFYVLVNGMIQQINRVLEIFSTLSVAETSAYLSYPVIAPVKLVANPAVQKPSDQGGARVSNMTYVLFGVPSVGAVIAIGILVKWYCQKGDNQVKQTGSTLDDADLKIDIEKGEVVSASVSGDKNTHSFFFDSGKGGFNPVWKHVARNINKAPGQQKRDLTHKKSLTGINSASQRLERLRKLGFRGCEIRKQRIETQEACIDTDGCAQRSYDGSELCAINDLDKPTNPGIGFCQTEVKDRPSLKNDGANLQDIQSDTFTEAGAFLLIDKENSPNASHLDLNIKPSHLTPVSSIRKSIDGVISYSSDSEVESGDIQSKRLVKFKRGSDHRKKKKLKQVRKKKTVQNTRHKGNSVNNFAQGEVDSFRPRVPSIPVEGFCDKMINDPFYTSLTLGKAPSSVNNSIEGGLEDEVFLADSIPNSDLSAKDTWASEETIPSAMESSSALARRHVKQNQRNISSRNHCDIIRTCNLDVKNSKPDEFKQRDTYPSQQKINPCGTIFVQESYLKQWSNDPMYMEFCCDNYTDGSEYAGHEFQSLNFTREYTNSDTDPASGPHPVEDTAVHSNMAEGMIGYSQRSGPGVCEHVTKMGRFGKGHSDLHSNRLSGPQFRKVLFQDQPFEYPSTKSSTPVPESPREIIRDLPNLRYIFPKRKAVKETGIQTVALLPMMNQEKFNLYKNGQETSVSEDEEVQLVDGVERNKGTADGASVSNGKKARDINGSIRKFHTKRKNCQFSMDFETTVSQDHVVSQVEQVTGKHTSSERQMGLTDGASKKSAAQSTSDLPFKKKKSHFDRDTSYQNWTAVPQDDTLAEASDVTRKNTISGGESSFEDHLRRRDNLDSTEILPEKKKNGSLIRYCVSKEASNVSKHVEVSKVQDVTGKKTAHERETVIENTPDREVSPVKMENVSQRKKEMPEEADTFSKDNGDIPHQEEKSEDDHKTGRKTTFERKFAQENRPGNKDTSLKNEKKRPKSKRQISGKQSPGTSIEDLPYIIEPPEPEIFEDPGRPIVKPAFPSYVEMKLGRNMRAAPKGSIAPRKPAAELNQQLLDATEPLLHNPSLPSNNIADYYASTQPTLHSQKTQGVAIASRQYPARSMTSPQHPSQHLIETLNRNSQTSLTQGTRLQDEQRQEREEEEHRRELELESYKEKSEAQKRSVQDFETKNLLLKELFVLANEPDVVNPSDDVTSPPPPPVVNLYGSYKVNDFTEPKQNDQASTRPFSPQNSATFKQAGETSAATSSLRGTSTHSEFKVQHSVLVEKQETVEEVEDIAEDIHVEADDDDDGSDDDKIKDDDLNF